MNPLRGRKAGGWRRAARMVVVALVVVELAWLVVANLVVNHGGFTDAVNMRPDRVLVQWQSVRSYYPGHVSGHGLTIRTNSTRTQSLLEAERFSAWISPAALLGRSLRLSAARFENVTARIRPARMVREAEPEELPFFPLIPGLEPLMPDTPPEFGPFKPGWLVDLADVTVTGSHHVYVGNYEIHGDGRLHGALSYRVRDRLVIEGIDAELGDARISLNGEPLAKGGGAIGRLSSAPFIPYFHPGLAKLAFLTIDAELFGELSSLEVLNFYLGVDNRPGWPGLSAEGRLSGRLVVEQGRLDPSTDLVVDSKLISFKTRNLALQSAGLIRLKPTDDTGRPSKLMTFELADLKLRHRTVGKTLVATRGLEFIVNSADATVGTPLRELQLRARVDRSEVPDLTVLNHFIPSKIPLVVAQGKGEIDADIAWDAGRMRGNVILDARNVRFTVEGSETTASFRLDLAMAADPDARTVSVTGTTLRIDDARLDVADASIDPWSAELNIETGRVEFRQGARESIKPGKVFAQLVDFTDGELRLAGSISNINFLDYLLTEERRLTFAGEGKFDADLTMEKGTIRTGSTATFRSANLAARFLDFDARGRGRLQAAFLAQNDQRALDIRAELEQVALLREEESAAFVQAPSVRFRLKGVVPDMTEPMEAFSITFEIDEATVPDITVYNAYLPEKSVLALESGSGVIRSRLDVEDNKASGLVSLEAEQVEAVVNDQALALDLDMNLRLSNGDLDSRRFELDDSSLRVSNVNYPGGQSLGEWFAEFSFTDGELHWTRPVSLTADSRLQMTSSGPLVELLAGSYTRVDWVKDLLSVNDVKGTGRLAVGAEAVIFNDLDIRGEEIQVAAKLRIDRDGPEGIVFNRYGPFKATIAFNGDQREWFIFSARERFDSHPGY